MKNRFIDQASKRKEDVIREAATLQNCSPIIVEKDFWACYVLDRVFALSYSDNLFFKGGTSLSKVYNAIERFSEDIDLGIEPEYLGWDKTKLKDPVTKTGREKQMKALQTDCTNFVQNEIFGDLAKLIKVDLGKSKSATEYLRFSDGSDGRSPTLTFIFPNVIKEYTQYNPSNIKLEFGSLTDQNPKNKFVIDTMINQSIKISPYKDITSKINVLGIERTFFEKATILHTIYHQSELKPLNPRYFRHYYDAAMIWSKPDLKKKIIDNIHLLEIVAHHKERYFYSKWSSYFTAKIGSLKLSPQEFRKEELKKDFEFMKSMFLNDVSFKKVMSEIANIEDTINGIT